MGFTKKRGRQATGRPPQEETNDNTFTDEERKTYNREAKRKERRKSAANENQSASSSSSSTNAATMTPTGKTTRSGKIYSPSTLSTEPKSVGRPPLNEIAMTPTSLKRRKRKLYYDKEGEKKAQAQTQATSTARANAVRTRWSQQSNEGQSSEIGSNHTTNKNKFNYHCRRIIIYLELCSIVGLHLHILAVLSVSEVEDDIMNKFKLIR